MTFEQVPATVLLMVPDRLDLLSDVDNRDANIRHSLHLQVLFFKEIIHLGNNT